MPEYQIKPIYCFISNDNEYKTLEFTANFISNYINQYANKNISIEIRCHPVSDFTTVDTNESSFVIYSLLHYVYSSPFNISSIKRQLINYSEKSIRNGAEFPYLLNIFQCYDMKKEDILALSINSTLRNIRELNLVALQLSQSHKFGILDIDSIFTKLGGENLATDFTLNSSIAHRIAANIIGSVFLEEYTNRNKNFIDKNSLSLNGYEGIMIRSHQLLTAKNNIINS